MWSMPYFLATSTVLSVDPAQITSVSILSTPFISLGRLSSTKGRVSSSFRHGIMITSFMQVSSYSPSISTNVLHYTGRYYIALHRRAGQEEGSDSLGRA